MHVINYVHEIREQPKQVLSLVHQASIIYSLSDKH